MEFNTWDIPAAILIFEYFLGGLPRLGAVPPLTRLHERIVQKSHKTAPHLHPVFPFTDPRSVKVHMQYVGLLMITEGVLLAMPRTRAQIFTLGLGCFLTGAGAWSQARAKLPYWVPVINFALAWIVWYLENVKQGRFEGAGTLKTEL